MDEISVHMMRGVMGGMGITDEVTEARLAKLERDEALLLSADPDLVAKYQKLLRIIAYTYQLAGRVDMPDHVLDVLGDPEGATSEQVEALL